MNQATVNLTFDDEILSKIDIIAKNESQTRTELIYNSIRMYINQKQKLQELYIYGEGKAAQSAFTEEDIYTEIKEFRKSK